MAQIEKGFVEIRQEMTSEELMDSVSVGRSFSGVMIGIVTYLFGCHWSGTLCGVLSELGILTATLIIWRPHGVWFLEAMESNT